MKTYLIVAGVLLLIGIILFLWLNPEAKNTVVQKVSGKPNTVTLHTNLGDITIQLYHEQAPKASENFWRLSKEGKYDGTVFHRVIEGFMVQGGDYENQDGTGGSSIWGAEFEDEFSPELSHIRGMVSMANRGPTTNGSQFFMVHKKSDYLDGRHTIFGQITDGLEVLDTISGVATDNQDRPFEDIRIDKTTVK